ncbi:1-(5-phosphoribosyl)-5-amino-4-imidazole-carboxylate carboxylase [candidate division LCP-89 bacterium B3_LCP]|uniref:1-(5-phosphoribosyl)-5-amino-4-imidazole-carboxylate carboxylase n=1 Tax=candidate division LCP-89 bacterium B3_LCP TaxID=2012998 RepID=A0A532V273_UNCL8|nr:MAG: 1-(5-phosphoribosyl)-5-amino-4-imidazole-carboxylate carboxylase [candidate division LCP-89 bacterium B3_LCP]
MNENTIKSWLADFKAGKLNEEKLIGYLKNLPFEDLDFAKVDHHRSLRRGFPEVIYGEGKDIDQIVMIAQKINQHGNPALITRLNEDKIEALIKKYPDAKINRKARTALLGKDPKSKRSDKTDLQGMVMTAGTSDMDVAEEAAETLEAFGYNCDRLYDVGVAGLHRLMAHRERILKANAIAVIAGMEGALASVVGGLVEVPVIAVPTSVGYGANFNGISALLGMLTGCAGGVAVVNIDNGFAAGYMLAVILRNLESAKK